MHRQSKGCLYNLLVLTVYNEKLTKGHPQSIFSLLSILFTFLMTEIECFHF